MDKKNLLVLLLISLSGFAYNSVYAQETDPDLEVNVWAQQPVTVDGNSAEWHEPLNNYNTGTKLAFALANDRQNLYVIIESLDEMTTRKVLSGGLTLNINTAGKKKDGFKINFLGMDRPPRPAGVGNDSLMHTERDRNVHETPVNVIQVAGFKRIPDGVLTIPNQQDIRVAAAFNKNRDYICELSIPLAELDLTGNEVKAIAYNIKFNKANKFADHKKGGDMDAGAGGMKGGMGGGMKGGRGGGGMGGGMAGGGGGMGGHGGGGGGRRGGGGGNNAAPFVQDDLAGRATDFWIKYELAKPGDTYRAN